MKTRQLSLFFILIVLGFSVLVYGFGNVKFVFAQEPSNQIAFVSNRDGNSEIYVMNADGSNQIRLTNNSAQDYSPVWSPDGKRIAFASTRGDPTPADCGSACSVEIYIGNFDGSGQLTDLANVPHSVWSPNGKLLAFECLYDEIDICVQNGDGSGEASRLFINKTLQHSISIIYGFTWSPDSTKIAVVGFSPSSTIGNIYIVNVDGSGTAKSVLTNPQGPSFVPMWSPDGTHIAFWASINDEKSELSVVDINDSTQTVLLSLSDPFIPAGRTYDRTVARGGKAVWSPDSGKIAVNTNGTIYVLGSDGSSEPKILADDADMESDPSWSPDGKNIVFSSQRDGNNEIYVMNADGNEQTRLTNNGADDFSPVWSPNNSIVEVSSETNNNEVAGSQPASEDSNNEVQSSSPATIPQSGGILSQTNSGIIFVFALCTILLLIAGGLRKQLR